MELLSHKMLTDGLDLVDYRDVFMNSHSDGTHSLQIGKYIQTCSVEETNSSTSRKALGWVHF